MSPFLGLFGGVVWGGPKGLPKSYLSASNLALVPWRGGMKPRVGVFSSCSP
jgi:hypothetical protein